ncbi:hypothetical protein TVAGG3_0478520 [Trichomonas vaginalis G3]|uniref:hypothetical protein n=1 Tax=Trichomonas vaginalis (strain ATCC PRA-98 / G3) TaxID=412133 RepID=UPI0021E58947|nr:hypothetical protein TVAGG3_0478520 [Trichomonas vaginalis G3]KAI5515533.1 hypothetical protein TVAGG3_0478520 [Trichomonas vaginalis G3]
MNTQEKTELLMNLQRFSAHRAIENANGNLERLNLLLENSIKSSEIRGLIAQNMRYTVDDNPNIRWNNRY